MENERKIVNLTPERLEHYKTYIGNRPISEIVRDTGVDRCIISYMLERGNINTKYYKKLEKKFNDPIYLANRKKLIEFPETIKKYKEYHYRGMVQDFIKQSGLSYYLANAALNGSVNSVEVADKVITFFKNVDMKKVLSKEDYIKYLESKIK